MGCAASTLDRHQPPVPNQQQQQQQQQQVTTNTITTVVRPIAPIPPPDHATHIQTPPPIDGARIEPLINNASTSATASSTGEEGIATQTDGVTNTQPIATVLLDGSDSTITAGNSSATAFITSSSTTVDSAPEVGLGPAAPLPPANAQIITSIPPIKPTSWTAASVISTGLLYLSSAAEMCPIAGADTVAATLKSIYSLFNSATTKEEWLAEFMVYLRDVEIEMCSASLTFQRQNYCQQLTRQLIKSKRVIEKITKRNRFIAIATADSDRLALENERSELEKIKSSSLMSMLTEMNSDTLAVKEEIQQIKSDLNSSQEITRLIQTRKEEFERNERLLGRLQPIPFESEIESQYINYLPNTRLSIIDTVGEWIQFSHSPSSLSSPIPPSRLFFLSGGPGSGKSCLSSVICNRYREDVVAIHFCLHDREITREAKRMVRSIAYQLAKRIPEYAEALHETIPAVFGNDLNSSTTSNDSSTITAADLWKRLIIDPLFPIKDEILKQRQSIGRKYIILIDALDEGAIGSDASSRGNDLLDILSTSIKDLPIWLNVLVTSRPEVAIVKKLQKYEPVELKCESAENLHDLRIYFRHFLESAINSNDLEAAVELLVTKSGGLMLCAHLMLYSHGLFPKNKPEDWTGRDYTKQPLAMDELRLWPSGLGDFYLTTLNRIRTKIEHNKNVKLIEYLGQQVPADLVQMLKIVSFILGAYEPLTLQTLSEMFQLPDFETVLRLLTPLRTLFPIFPAAAVTSDPSPSSPFSSPSPSPTHSSLILTSQATVSVFHKSVYDWFLSPDRKLDDEQVIYYCDYAAIHRTMAECCFERLISKRSLPTEDDLAASPFSSVLSRHRQQLSSLPSSTHLLPSPPFLCSVEVTHLIHPDVEVVPPMEDPDMPRVHGKFIHPAHPQHPLFGPSECIHSNQLSCLVCQRCDYCQNLTVCLTCATEAETQLLRECGIGQIQLDLSEHPPSNQTVTVPAVTTNDDHAAKSKTKKNTHPTHNSHTGSKLSQPKKNDKSSIEKLHPQPKSKVTQPSTHFSHGSKSPTGNPTESKSPDQSQFDIDQFINAHCRIAICEDCMKEPYQQFLEENQKRVNLFNTNRPLSTLDASSFLSYSIRRGSSHALDSDSLAHVTGFLCHLQYWETALLSTGSGDATTFISRVQRAISQQWTFIAPPPSSDKLSPIYWTIPADLWGDHLTHAPLITKRLQECLIQHMRFYQLQSHHFAHNLGWIYQDAMMMPTISLVCQQAFHLLPTFISNTSLLPRIGLLDAPNKPQELSNLLQVIATPNSLRQLIMTKDGHLIVTTNGSETFVWDALTGEKQKTLHNFGTVFQVTLSLDETRVATTALFDRVICYRVFNIENDEILLEVDFTIPILQTPVFEVYEVPVANWIRDDQGRFGYQFIIGQNNHHRPILSLVNGPSQYLESVELERLDELVWSRSEVVMMSMSPTLDACIVCLDWSVKLVVSRQNRLVCIGECAISGSQEPRKRTDYFNGLSLDAYHHLLFLDHNRVFITLAEPEYPTPEAAVFVFQINTNLECTSPLTLIHSQPRLTRLNEINIEYTPCIAAINLNRLNDTLILALARGNGGSSTIEIWHSRTFEVMQTVELNDWCARSLHTNGTRFAMISGQKKSVFEYDLPSCQLLGQHGEELNHSQYVHIKQSNGELKERLLTTNEDGRIRLWEPKLKSQLSSANNVPRDVDVTFTTEHHLSSCGRYSLQVSDNDWSMSVWDWMSESPSTSSSAQPAGMRYNLEDERFDGRHHMTFIPQVNSKHQSADHQPLRPIILQTVTLLADDSHVNRAFTLPDMTPATSKELRSICEPNEPFDETEMDLDVLPRTATVPPIQGESTIKTVFQQPISIHQSSVARKAKKAHQQILDKLIEKNIFTHDRLQPLVCFGSGDAADLLFLCDTHGNDSRGLLIYSWTTGQLLYHQSLIEAWHPCINAHSIYFDDTYQQLWIQLAGGSPDSPLYYQVLHLKRTNSTTTTSSSSLDTTKPPHLSSLGPTCDLVVTSIGLTCSMKREKGPPIGFLPFGRFCFIFVRSGHMIECADIRTNETVWSISLPNTIHEPIRIHPNLTHLMVLEESKETILVLHLTPWMKELATQPNNQQEQSSINDHLLSSSSTNQSSYPARSPSIPPPIAREYSFSPPAVHTNPPRFLHLHCID